MRRIGLAIAVVWATPAVLLLSTALWLVGFSQGLDSWSASLLGLTAMVSGMAVLDVVLPRPDLPPRPAGSLPVDLCFNALAGLMALVLPTFVYVPLGALASVQLGTASLWVGLPMWLSAVACVLLVDFLSYWWHRLQHTTGTSWLWRLHSVHHAATHYDFWMGARVHPLDVLGFGLCSYGLLAVLGAPPVALEFAAFLAAIIGAIHHTRARTDCGWMNRLIPMADHHLMHHSANPEHNGNFGNVTTLFDQLYGTWVAPSPRQAPPLGAWSLAEDYPQHELGFLLLSPFGRWWRRARRDADPAPPRSTTRPTWAGTDNAS